MIFVWGCIFEKFASGHLECVVLRKNFRWREKTVCGDSALNNGVIESNEILFLSRIF